MPTTTNTAASTADTPAASGFDDYLTTMSQGGGVTVEHASMPALPPVEPAAAFQATAVNNAATAEASPATQKRAPKSTAKPSDVAPSPTFINGTISKLDTAISSLIDNINSLSELPEAQEAVRNVRERILPDFCFVAYFLRNLSDKEHPPVRTVAGKSGAAAASGAGGVKRKRAEYVGDPIKNMSIETLPSLEMRGSAHAVTPSAPTTAVGKPSPAKMRGRLPVAGIASPLNVMTEFPPMNCPQLIHAWILGSPTYNVPPLSTVKSKDITHFKNGAQALSNIKAFMRVVEIVGREEGVWKERINEWDAVAINTLWGAVEPQFIQKNYIPEFKRGDGSFLWGSVLNKMKKAKVFIALRNTVPGFSHDEFPDMTSYQLLVNWLLGDSSNNIPPMHTLKSKDVKHIRNGKTLLCSMRSVMKVVKLAARKHGIWRENVIDWDAESVLELWYMARSYFEENGYCIETKSLEECSWRSVYSKMVQNKALCSEEYLEMR